MYLIQFIFCRIAILILLIFPEKLRFSFGDFLGLLTFKFIKKRKKIALLNLKAAFPDKKEEELEEIALKSFKIMIKAFLCTLWFNSYLKKEKSVKIVNEESIDNLMKEHGRLIVATMHMGNMEASIKAAANYEVITVAKKQRNPYINALMTRNREKYINIEVIEKDKFTSKKLIKRIHENKIFALFSDHRDKGAIVNFFNMEAKAPTGAISLALKYNIPLILVYNIMNDDNSSTVFVSDQINLDISDNFKNDVNHNTQKLITIMENIIKEHPEQWMWFHDRWNLYRNSK